MRSAAFVLLGVLLPACPLRAAAKATPFPLYPGVIYSKKASDKYRDERAADAAWAYAVKSSFKKVTFFYKQQVKGRATAETESRSMYFAITATGEIRVQKAKKGWVLIYMAKKRLVTGSGGQDGEGQGGGNGPGGDPRGGDGGGAPIKYDAPAATIMPAIPGGAPPGGGGPGGYGDQGGGNGGLGGYGGPGGGNGGPGSFPGGDSGGPGGGQGGGGYGGQGGDNGGPGGGGQGGNWPAGSNSYTP